VIAAPMAAGGRTGSDVRPTHVVVDLDAITHNTTWLAGQVAPAGVCAVVKADAYGHGSVPVARAALAGGAVLLAVAMVEEALVLRDAGVDAPILVLSQPPHDDLAAAVAAGVDVAVYSPACLEALRAAVAASPGGGSAPVGVHVKVDTGMHRLGTGPGEAVELAAAVASSPGLRLAGVWTHCACADEAGDTFTALQVDRFTGALVALEGAGVHPGIVHMANSAAGLFHPRTRFDVVRFGISLYGIHPAPDLGGDLGLRPALSVRSEVVHTTVVPAGEGVSYGLRRLVDTDTLVATIPVGYADGVARSLFRPATPGPAAATTGTGAGGGGVLIGGRFRPLAGTVTMDYVMADCGPVADTGSPPVRVGDEAVLVGTQGDASITAWDWADATGSIPNEVLSRLGARAPRQYLP
jgi:alanine racemase